MKDISDAVIEAPAIAGDQLVLPDNNDGLTLADYVPVLMQTGVRLWPWWKK